jgi:hypothetical protein
MAQQWALQGLGYGQRGVPIPEIPAIVPSRDVVWDPATERGGVLLQSSFLNVTSGSGTAQGVTINARHGQSSSHHLPIYFELEWAFLETPNLVGGIGVALTQTTGSTDTFTPFYAAFAANGTGGVLLRPNGDIWVNGSQIVTGAQTGISQLANDTIGIVVNFQDLLGPTVSFILLRKRMIVNEAELPFPSGNYSPFVVFDSVPGSQINSVTANFTGPNFEITKFDPTYFKDIGVAGGWPA